MKKGGKRSKMMSKSLYIAGGVEVLDVARGVVADKRLAPEGLPAPPLDGDILEEQPIDRGLGERVDLRRVVATPFSRGKRQKETTRKRHVNSGPAVVRWAASEYLVTNQRERR